MPDPGSPGYGDLFNAIRKVVPLSVDGKAVNQLAQSLVPQTPKRRAAVVLHDGLSALDTYHAVRPKLFVGSVAVAVGATGMAWWRRRNGAEAITSWSILAGLAGVVAYLTRPGAGTGTPTAGTGATGTERVYSWLDARAATLDRQEPGWEDRVARRVLG